MKRIAIATADGVSVSEHLARAAAFVVVDLTTGERTVRARGTETCGNHATFVEMLAGCDAVICGGIGQGAAVSLAAHGIQSLVSPESVGATADEALLAWKEGRLVTSDERVCLCSH
ncbi:MAG: NifB/NifX family molybdenum-iron cluster-binding protein [Candidatus Solibacter sp.]